MLDLGHPGRAVVYVAVGGALAAAASYVQRRRQRPFSSAMWTVIVVGTIVLTLIAGEVLVSVGD